VDFLSKTVTLEGENGEQELIYQIWDVAGQSGFTNFRHLYLKKAHGVFLVYDLSRIEETYTKLKRWRDDVQEQSPNAKIIVIGNKEDLLSGGVPNSKEKILEELSAQEFITTSAKTGSKVEDAFVTMGKLILGE
ncbi:MAG: GTP-binding protein, partial [Candidatus Hodarchaeales archaeon]